MASVPSPTAKADIKIDEDKELADYFNELYDTDSISNEELKLWFEIVRYKGFDRIRVIKDMMKKLNKKIAQQAILLCGLQGPQRAATTPLPDGKTLQSYGISASGLKGSEGISCQRIVAATADLCAYFLKKLNVPKRLDMPCPGWLQFPSAGSINLPPDLRIMHKDFSIKFSSIIGGVFNEQIYMQMMANAYLDPKLHLFDDHVPTLITAMQYTPAPSSAPIVRSSVASLKPQQSDKLATARKPP
jgi:hypothetical protein